MAKPQFSSADEYIAAQPETMQGILERVRSAILKALPRAEEVISYNILAYKLNDEAVLHLAAWKGHYSLHGSTAAVQAAFKRELKPYKISRGTIRFPLSQPIPLDLIKRIAKFRANEVKQRASAKGASHKKR
jgi:uncharacterized protein YdhG (YjbR/CyaY superfamily)